MEETMQGLSQCMTNTSNCTYHVNCNLRFCGQYEDEESGLYYNRFRYYHPQTGQY
ncbi:hypothetical protein KKJ16_22610, partial [Xenorhabdus bovienii]|nr:hypothetical protein [Xenorhabdus bovienii]